MEIPVILLYVGLGVVGGILYVVMPPATDNKPDALKQIVLGGIVGGVLYLVLLATNPSELAKTTTYLSVIAVSYAPQDFIKWLLSHFGIAPGSGSSGNIPLTKSNCAECS